jgi:O-antigen/teichoic acid export membrane protein
VLLGISDIKTVLLVDIAGTVAKFGTAFVLIYAAGFGAFGILLSLLVQGFVATALNLYALRGMFRTSILKDWGYLWDLFKEGLSNLPFKLSKVFIMSLSVVLLGAFGVHDSDIGVFYICLMITIVVSSLSASIAFMVVPASVEEKADLSAGGARIGISLTAPLIAALVTAPAFVLSLLGTQYVTGELVLLVLSYGTLPFSVTLNAVSGLNNTGNLKRITYIGAIEISSFLLLFWLLVPDYGTLGAAFSMLVAFILSCIPGMAWSGRAFIKYVAAATISVLTGTATGYALGLILGGHMPVLQIFGCVTVTIFTIIILKNTTPGEIRSAFHTLVKIKR